MIGMILLLASCGQQHQARTLVDDFMEANLADPKALNGVSYASLDSTRVISDSLIGVMRSLAKQNPRFKSDIAYAERKSTRLLYITRVDYCLNQDSCQDTYYLDDSLTGVVAFKSNY